ncbi:hypothetical protein AAC387_Pa05g0548 [Persea americana]
MKTCIKLLVVTPILLILSDTRILRDAVVQDPATPRNLRILRDVVVQDPATPWNLRFGARLFKTLIGKINARICSHQPESAGPKGQGLENMYQASCCYSNSIDFIRYQDSKRCCCSCHFPLGISGLVPDCSRH